MNKKMTLLFLKKTNQVLASIVRISVPDTALSKDKEQSEKNEAAELEVLAGDKLLVRDLPAKLGSGATAIPDFITTGVFYPSAELGALTTDFDPTVLIDARKFFINSDKKPQLGLDVPTSPPIAAFTFTATAATITLDLINPVTADTGVWVQIHEVGTALEPQTVSSVIKHDDPPPANHSTTISVQLSPGNYRFLTSIGGYKPIVYGATI